MNQCDDDTRFIHPTSVLTEERDAVLTEEQVRSWRESGCALVSGVLPEALVDSLRDHATQQLPAPDTAEARATADFGSRGRLTFPSPCAALNEVTLHPRLLTAVAQLLGVPVAALRLTQSDLWPKYGRAERTAGVFDNQDQRIHVDYPNHTLVHPTPWDRPEGVELILYLSDVEVCGGATAVVPRRGADDPAYPWPIVDTPGVGELDYLNDRSAAEAYMSEQRPAAAPLRALLYERERYVRYASGSILLYRHDAWHRGTPMQPGTLRIAQNMTFRRADCEWISTLHVGWAWAMYRRDKFMERLIAAATLDQRAVLGFPQPGSPYWCPATLEAVEARYGVFGMDMAPYRAQLA